MLKLAGSATLTFAGKSEIDAWAEAGLEAAVTDGYVGGFPGGSFLPLRTTTRAQVDKVSAVARQQATA